MSPEERAEVKKVARELLDKIKGLLVINWRQKSSARSQLKLAIEDVLDGGLPPSGSGSWPRLINSRSKTVAETALSRSFSNR